MLVFCSFCYTFGTAIFSVLNIETVFDMLCNLTVTRKLLGFEMAIALKLLCNFKFYVFRFLMYDAAKCSVDADKI